MALIGNDRYSFSHAIVFLDIKIIHIDTLILQKKTTKTSLLFLILTNKSHYLKKRIKIGPYF